MPGKQIVGLYDIWISIHDTWTRSQSKWPRWPLGNTPNIIFKYFKFKKSYLIIFLPWKKQFLEILKTVPELIGTDSSTWITPPATGFSAIFFAALYLINISVFLEASSLDRIKMTEFRLDYDLNFLMLELDHKITPTIFGHIHTLMFIVAVIFIIFLVKFEA